MDESYHATSAEPTLREQKDTLNRQLRILPPERWPADIVQRMGELEEALANKVELDKAKLYGSTSGRVETLVDTQSILDYLTGLADPAESRAALQRIRVRLPVILEGITVAVDGIHGHSKRVYLKIAYKGGHLDLVVLQIGNPGPGNNPFIDEVLAHGTKNHHTCQDCPAELIPIIFDS